MAFISVNQLTVNTYVNYYNRLHIVKNVYKTGNFTNVILKGVYLPNSIINLIYGPLSQIEVVEPECAKYKITKWLGGDQFEITNEELNNLSIKIKIPEYSQKISYDLSINKQIYIEMYKYNNIYDIFSIS